MALVLRILRRLLAFTAYGAAIAALVFIIWPLLPVPDRSGGTAGESAAAADTRAKQRPKSLPYRIPTWAWQLHAWMLKPSDQRGARPKAAPAHVPQWFWDFRKWRLALAPKS